MSDKTMSVAEAVERTKWLLADGHFIAEVSDIVNTLLARAAEPTLRELREAADEYKTATDHAGWNVRMFCSAGGVLCFADAVAVQWATDAEALPAIRAATAAERAKREPKEPDLSKCGGRCCWKSDGKLSLDYCDNRYGEWACTMPDGHDGPHIACDFATHDLASWPNEPAPAQPVTLEAVQAKLNQLHAKDPYGWRCELDGRQIKLRGREVHAYCKTPEEAAMYLDAELAKHAKPEPTPAERFERLVTNLRQKSPQSTEDIRAIRAALAHPAQSEPQP